MDSFFNLDHILAIRSLVPNTNSGLPQAPDLTSSLSFGTPNASTSAINDSQHHQEVEYWKDAQIVFLVVLMVTIVVGNAAVLAAITLSRDRRRTRMNFFLTHLAICDMLTGPLVVLADLIQKLTTYWYAGDTLCKFHKFTQVSVTYASTYMLVALSMDRLDAVARPMSLSSSQVKAKLMVSIAWALSVVFAIPELFLFGVGVQFGGPMCLIDFTEQWQWQAYLTPIAVTLFIIPAISIFICYLNIIAIIWRSSQILQRSNGITHRHRDQELLRGRYIPSWRPGQDWGKSRCVISPTKIRTVKMTFIIVLVFIVCWCPYFIFNLCQVYGLVPDTVPMLKASTFVQSMAPLNSAANPIIYCLFSTQCCECLRRVSLCQRVTQQERQGWAGRGSGSGRDSESRSQGEIFRSLSPRSLPPTGSGSNDASVTEAEELQLSYGVARGTVLVRWKKEVSGTGACLDDQTGSPGVPYVKQEISEADHALLRMHVGPRSQE